MKTLLSLLAMLFAFQFSYAQWSTSGSNTTTTNNVGVGTTSPIGKLNIFDSTAGNSLIVLSRSTDPTVKALDVTLNSDNTVFTTANADLNFKTNFNGGAPLSTMYLTYQGNVGIGTTNPAVKLDVTGSINLGIGYNLTWGGAYGAGIPTIAGNTSGMLFYPAGSTSGESMRINSSGNVGIGTSIIPTGYKLAVNGNIIAAGVQILPHGNWPDYVFKPQYKLPSLSEVKSYIDQNQHLPDMPSEQEVAKEGIDLGEIVKLQTKKIEELTLYLIELKRENEELQKDQATIKKTLQQHHIN